MLAIRLTDEIEQRLEALAKATGRTKTFYARAAILEYLDDIEDVYLAEQRLTDLRAGNSGTVKLDFEAPRKLLRAVQKSAAAKTIHGVDAAHSQDFLYGEDGLPE